MYVYICIHMYVDMYKYIYICININIYKYVCVCVYIVENLSNLFFRCFTWEFAINKIY